MKNLWHGLCDDLRFAIRADNLPLRAEQLRARLNSYPVMIAGQALLNPLLIWLFWAHAPHAGLLLWGGALYALHSIEMLGWWRSRTQLHSVAECQRWHRRFVFFTAAVGLCWGSFAWWFFPPDFALHALLICIVLGLASGAVTMNPVHPPALYIYVCAVTLPLMLRLMLENNRADFIMAMMMLLFVLVVLNAGRELSRTFELALQRRYENDALLQRLQQQIEVAQEAQQEAQVADRNKSRFLAAASHDLRQPLQALVLFSEALKARAPGRELEILAGQIDQATHALVSMFNELLDLSKLDAGMVQARWQVFALQPLLDRLYVEFALLAQDKKLAFDIEPSKAMVRSDPVLLERVLRNLISNAIRYTDSGSVLVRNQPDANCVHLAVADTGIGIPAEALPHIFDEYYQVDNAHRDRRRGLGLGLSIVRRIERLLQATLSVQSTQGVGTTFRFDVALGDASEETFPFAMLQSQHDLHGVRVLLLEDDPDIRTFAADLMQQWGCQVNAAAEPAAAIAAVQQSGQIPELLVCDYRLLHGATAVEAIGQMRVLWGERLPALVLTGDTASETLELIHASRAVLLHKPISPARLRSMMYLALHGEEQGDAA